MLSACFFLKLESWQIDFHIYKISDATNILGPTYHLRERRGINAVQRCVQKPEGPYCRTVL